MRLLTTTVLIATLGVSACGTIRDSRVNPFNWFGTSRSAPVEREEVEQTNPLIPDDDSRGLFSGSRNASEEYNGTPVDQITALVIERVPGGAIVRATGVSAYDNPFRVQLTPTTDEATPVDGVLTYRLEAERIRDATRTTSTRVRTVNAAVRLSDQDLSGVRVIRVEGVRNAQTTTRR
ncbi:MAG: hypothetical protein AAF252_12705 [Pseudomonadota bacterium]